MWRGEDSFPIRSAKRITRSLLSTMTPDGYDVSCPYAMFGCKGTRKHGKEGDKRRMIIIAQMFYYYKGDLLEVLGNSGVGLRSSFARSPKSPDFAKAASASRNDTKQEGRHVCRPYSPSAPHGAEAADGGSKPPRLATPTLPPLRSGIPFGYYVPEEHWDDMLRDPHFEIHEMEREKSKRRGRVQPRHLPFKGTWG